MSRLKPEIGQWFQNAEDGSKFEVVAVDDRRETVEVQYIDGEIDEFEYDNWSRELLLVPIEKPENWRGPFGMDDDDDDEDQLLEMGDIPPPEPSYEMDFDDDTLSQQ